MQYDVVIPVGGKGGQMYPLSAGMPKTLIPIGTEPLLVRILRSLDPNVFNRALVICNRKYKRMIESYVKAFATKKQFGFVVDYEIVAESKERPTDVLRRLVRDRRVTDPFLLHYGDVELHNVKWDSAYQEWNSLKGDDKIIAMLFVCDKYPFPVGVVVRESKREHLVMQFIEKPEFRLFTILANCAVAWISKELVNKYVKRGKEGIFDQGIEDALKANEKIALYPVDDFDHFQNVRDWLEAQG